MFATRANQENAIYEQQQAAASKPLNQGVKGLAPKTPANKGSKLPLNDENATLAGGKTGGKTKQDGLFGEGKSGKVDRSAFVTPAGPRNRAPLGNKTTNAKATAFQTPAPPTQEKPSAKPSSPRMRRAKIKIHEAESSTVGDEQEEREIEYMPPREVPLPDHPDDWPHDRTYPQFEGKNLTSGWWSEFGSRKDENEDEEFSDFEEKLKRIEELNQKKKHAAQQAKKATAVKKVPMQKTSRDPLTAKPPQTLKSRSAASALSSSTKPTTSTKNAAPTNASNARFPSALSSKKPATPNVAANPRHATAKVASNSTLGYSKGRVVSSSARNPQPAMQAKQPSVAEKDTAHGKPEGEKAMTLDELFDLQDLKVNDEDSGRGLGDSDSREPAGLVGDDDEEVFQLDSAEL